LQNENAEISWDGLEEHAHVLRAYLARRCRDDSEADDVAQEALVRAARFRSRLQDVGKLRSWILRIGASVLRDHLRRERRQLRCEGALELLVPLEGREPEPGQWAEDELACLEGQLVERAQLMSEIELALQDERARDRQALARMYGAELCREAPAGCRDAPAADEPEAVPSTRRKERLWRARQRLYRRLSARVRCVVRCGDEFAPARLAETCTGGGALALARSEPESGARSAQRG
jgi:DNA-directed RNA polymerase specialized sigma24 family protein